MSHFSVLVLGENWEKQLAPYHEFECTGVDDEHVKTIDVTENTIDDWKKHTDSMVQLADGTLVSKFNEEGEWDRRWLRPLTDWEKENNPNIWMSDIKSEDGKTYRTRTIDRVTWVIDFGADNKEIEVPTTKTLEKFIAYWHEKEILDSPSKIDLADKHKYGYALRQDDGSIHVFKRTNPNSHWDWYQMGGRWTGFFRVRDRVGMMAVAGPTPKRGEKSWAVEEPEFGTADSLMKRDIDFEAMRAAAGARAAEWWDKVHAVIDQHPPITPWEKVREQFGDGGIKEARDFYHDQPGIRALRSNKETAGVWEVEEYLVSREEHIEDARQNACIPFAIVKDGQWYQKGRMGWWGIVTGEQDQKEWNKRVNELIDSVPDTTLFTIVDCHI